MVVDLFRSDDSFQPHSRCDSVQITPHVSGSVVGGHLRDSVYLSVSRLLAMSAYVTAALEEVQATL